MSLYHYFVFLLCCLIAVQCFLISLLVKASKSTWLPVSTWLGINHTDLLSRFQMYEYEAWFSWLDCNYILYLWHGFLWILFNCKVIHWDRLPERWVMMGLKLWKQPVFCSHPVHIRHSSRHFVLFRLLSTQEASWTQLSSSMARRCRSPWKHLRFHIWTMYIDSWLSWYNPERSEEENQGG